MTIETDKEANKYTEYNDKDIYYNDDAGDGDDDDADDDDL